MTLTIILGLLGGLALFLYGMKMMSDGLEAAAGDRLKIILEKLTVNRFMGILVGAFITAIIQSSSATTVMVVGFVNAKMMTIHQAVWIIMGANIGTTMTGQLIALDVGVIAPLFAFLGVMMIIFFENPKLEYYGSIIAGLGILFIGMDMMSNAMLPLRDLPIFVEMVTRFSHPFIGILVGALFTAVIQSSSASVGILQALAMSGIIQLDNAVYVLFGQNIGTCITAILASLTASREAKQTTIIHLSFNVIGTIIFTIVCMTTPLTRLIEKTAPGKVAFQIANMHTLFNVVTTMILLPFGTRLASLSEMILPVSFHQSHSRLENLKKTLGLSATNLEIINEEVLNMIDLAYQNVYQSIGQFAHYSQEVNIKINEREHQVNDSNEEIATYISEVLSANYINRNISNQLSLYYGMLVDIERISDYAVNIEKQAELQYPLGHDEINYIDFLEKKTKDMHMCLQECLLAKDINKQTHKYVHIIRQKLIELLKEKKITSEVSIMLSRIVTDFQRINDHALNIAEAYQKINQAH
ncbi:MAG: Na/Pi cotransporter family protein [Faecalibacillus sp.]